MSTAIRLDGVTKHFGGSGSPAVDGLTLDLPGGAITVLVGPSGCGKTTVLRMVNRLVEPTGGRVLIDGTDVRSQPVHELRRRIGHVIQSGGLFPHRTVAANIATVPRLLGRSRTDVADRVDELAELVGLDADLLGRYPSELSGGQRQRVGVARALAADPPILLMDEPYSAVDPVVRARLQDELLALQDRLQRTVVFVTHDIDEAIRLGDNIAVVNTGAKVEQIGTPDQLLAAPATPFVAAFVGRDRNLRRAALRTVGDALQAGAPSAVAASDPDGSTPIVERSTNLRTAIDLAAGAEAGAVHLVDDDGTGIVLTLADLVRALR